MKNLSLNIVLSPLMIFFKWHKHSKNNINIWAHFRAGALLPGNPSQILFSANAGLGGDEFKCTFDNTL